jgi:hypothetical protein
LQWNKKDFSQANFQLEFGGVTVGLDGKVAELATLLGDHCQFAASGVRIESEMSLHRGSFALIFFGRLSDSMLERSRETVQKPYSIGVY